MNHRQAAVLYKRPYTQKSGRKITVFWYYVIGPEGRRHRHSPGTTSKTKARFLLAQKTKAGTLIPRERRFPPFKEFTRDFGVWERCPYIKGRLLRGERISRKWARQNRGYLGNHHIPAFGKTPLNQITVLSIDRLLFDLKEQKGLSNKSVNQIFCSLRTILEEACRQGLLESNPCRKVRLLRQEYRRRGILTPTEAKRLLSNPQLWDSFLLYVINLTACTTGARLGELRALKVEKVFADRLVIDSVMRPLEGYIEGETKTGCRGFRIIPLPSLTTEVLQIIMKGRKPEQFVFSLTGDKPIGSNTATRALFRALGKIGITEEKRRERNISFHSWRHLYHSLLRGRISDEELRITAGHTTIAMTDRYSHRMPEHIERFRLIQEEVFAVLKN